MSIEYMDDHKAKVCMCGSANFALLKSGLIECNLCQKITGDWTGPVKLIDRINEAHGGRKDKFAVSMGVSPQQVSRWLKYECIWHNGAVWKQQSKSNGKILPIIEGDL